MARVEREQGEQEANPALPLGTLASAGEEQMSRAGENNRMWVMDTGQQRKNRIHLQVHLCRGEVHLSFLG